MVGGSKNLSMKVERSTIILCGVLSRSPLILLAVNQTNNFNGLLDIILRYY